MQEGKIPKKRMLWHRFESPKLNLEKNKYAACDRKDYKSCGTAILSLLTDISPKSVEKHCPNPKKGWYTSRIIKFLEEKGYTVVEISKNNVLSNCQYNPSLNRDHCLLINARVDDEENSLYLLHKDQVWHHFDVQANSDPLFFFNKPTQDVLLVYHPKWRASNYYTSLA